jgi:hypothetical protein
MSLEALFLTPLAVVFLFLLLFPWKPVFLTRGILSLLWDTGIPVGRYKIRLVHFLLLITAFFFYGKLKSYIYVNKVILSPFEGEVLSPDIKVKKYHAQRDLAITLTALMCWLYVCGFANLMHRLTELKEQARIRQSSPVRQSPVPQSPVLQAPVQQSN